MPKASIVHVGVNKKHGRLGPIFGDGKFRFVPIPENQPSEKSWTYDQLGLSEYVPLTWIYAHNDPEFKTFTWGDYKNKRTFCTRQLSQGDFVFFIASLAYNSSRTIVRKAWVADYGMYVIGYFELEEIPQENNISYPIPSAIKEKYANNAHIRWASNKEQFSPFLIFKGGEHSKTLDIAVPFSVGSKPNTLAERVIPNLNPNKPRWWSDAIINKNGVREIFDEINEKNHFEA